MQRVQSFSEINEESAPYAGGKGGTLARLYQKGYPVPDGFVLLTLAFNEDGLLPEAWEQIKKNVNRLRENNAKAFAVRSSALSEDSSETSFAGEFETVLGVQGEEEILEAIQTVWSSRVSERVRSYSEIHGLEGEQEIAVVVQSLVDSKYAGVLFTVDPVSGRHTMLGNYVHGMGDKLVSGEADAIGFTFSRPEGGYQGPRDLEAFSGELYGTALRLEEDLGSPQDIEWAVADDRLYLLQSRPITTLNVHDPKKGYYNESLLGDYLWCGAGVAASALELDEEALPGVRRAVTAQRGAWVYHKGGVGSRYLVEHDYFASCVLDDAFLGGGSVDGDCAVEFRDDGGEADGGPQCGGCDEVVAAGVAYSGEGVVLRQYPYVGACAASPDGGDERGFHARDAEPGLVAVGLELLD